LRIALVYDVVYPFVVGGVQRRNHAVASHLARRHRVTFYGFESWDETGEGLLPGCRYVGVGRPEPLYTASGRRRFSEALLFALRLIGPLGRGDDEVWDIANFPYLSIPAAWAMSKLRKRALVVTWHEFWGPYWDERLGRLGFLGRLLERACLALSPTIVTVSRFTRDRIVAAGVDPAKVHVVPNGIDIGAIRNAPLAAVPSDLIWAGRLVAHKQPGLALRAFALLHQADPSLRFVVVGDGPERERLEALAGELGVAGAVRFAGFVERPEELFGLMKASRVLLAPSKKEGFGIMVVEGWAAGLPAVVCREPESALPELIDDPLAGRVAASTPEAVAAACAELLTREGRGNRALLAERAARYDWRRVASELEEVYRTAIGGTLG